MIFVEDVIIVLALCATLSLLSWKLGLLTYDGSLASFVMGMIIGVFGGIGWLFILILFALTGFVVTRYKMDLKVRKGVQEGKRGERSYRNVVANGAVPALIAVVSYISGWEGPVPVLVYLSAICVAAADTTASELGILSDRVYMVTTFKKVAPGVDGGVSLYGSAWALLASTFAALIGWMAIMGTVPEISVLVPIVMGISGCFIDSFIGATLETKGLVSKLWNNVTSMAFGAVIALITLL
jgi:uncharacterized protein (TIGR00297 family)